MVRAKLLVSFLLLSLVLALAAGFYVAHAWEPLAVAGDPLVRMPGTQPGQVSLESPGRCLNCHAGYNDSVEPGFNWKGSMMAQSARDFLFWACMTVAGQDSIWAIGTPNAVDICERCHFPKGWLEGRSDPPNASAMSGADYDGVQCDFCHTLWDPFFETTHAGSREGSDWLGYWDETNASSTPSGPAADATYQEDASLAGTIQQFNGSPFFSDNEPPATYTENASGQYFVSPNSAKRAPFADAAARHQMLYSRYHKSKYFCATCHDVSNPALANLGADPTQPLPTELNSASSYFHVERTYSEFMLSAYGQPGGAATNSEFQDQGAPNITHAAKCQDCHMRDVVGEACNKKGVPIRPNDSVEHPNSGQPLHDMTGGNAWVSAVLASSVPGSPNYDSTNDTLLNQGPATLTLDLSQGEGIDPVALLAGADRAKQQLLLAATIREVAYDAGSGVLSFKVQNNTGHKLISGFPEGRRMFINIRAYQGDNLIYEVNPYDAGAGTLRGLTYPYDATTLRAPCALGSDYNPATDGCEPLTHPEHYVDALVYEMKPTVDLRPAGIDFVEQKSFHFALATDRYKDNRIPPKGFDKDAAADRLAQPVWQGTIDPDYFDADEYAGGYDAVGLADYSISIPQADYVEVNLYYQTTSREYIEFLRNEINGAVKTLPAEAYIIQTDPFFSQLAEWGDTIWQLWTHNMNVPGAAPFRMAQATVGDTGGGCTAPTPTLESATPGQQEVVLSWSDEHSADPNVVGYRVYYDQAGKSQLVTEVGLTTSYTDSGLTNGQEYCYKVAALYDVDADSIADCESAFSNVLCAIPNNQGQARAGVTTIETGRLSGKGKNKQFELTSTFNAGDQIIFRAHVVDSSTGLPVSGATVDLAIGGPEATTLTTGPSDAAGVAEATWNTQSANKRGQGGTTPGTYAASVTNVTVGGYSWDGVETSVSFTIQ